MTILSRLKRALTVQESTRKTDVVTFTRLDYWTMLELFDRFPLNDLVRLNGFVSWWSGYVDKVCLTKRSIAVHCGYKFKLNPDRCRRISIIDGDGIKNKVKVVTINSTNPDRLGHLLPRITSLEVIIGGSQPFTLSDVIYLISQWSHQLVDLNIRFHSSFVSVDAANNENHFNELLLSLNTITTLRRLAVSSGSSKCRLNVPIDLPLLAWLQYFYFCSGEDDFSNFRDSLVLYAGPNVALQQIELPFFLWLDHMWDDVELLDLQLTSKFPMLIITDATRHEWALFPNLEDVCHQLQLNSRSRFMELITEMQYSHVNTLSLAFGISTGFDRNSGQVLPNPPPLQSITKLELLVMSCEKHLNLYSAYKSLKVNLKMFPNVQAVHLKYFFLHLSSGALLKVFKIWRKISMPIWYRMFKRRVQRDFPGVKYTFEKVVYVAKDKTEAAEQEALFYD